MSSKQKASSNGGSGDNNKKAKKQNTTTTTTAASPHETFNKEVAVELEKEKKLRKNHQGSTDKNKAPDFFLNFLESNEGDAEECNLKCRTQFIGNFTVFPYDVARLTSDSTVPAPKKYLNDEMVEYAFYFIFLLALSSANLFVSLSTAEKDRLPKLMSFPWRVLPTQFYMQLTKNVDLLENNYFDSYCLVRNWFTKVDYLALDFLAVPINISYHWSIVFVVRPNALLLASSTSSAGCILFHVDPLGDYHDTNTIAEHLKHHLLLTFLDDRNATRRDLYNEQEMRRTIQKIPVIKPRTSLQQNFFDCGTYVGLFFDRFLKEYLKSKEEGREFALPRDTEIFADIKPKDANNLRTNLVADAKERKIKAAAEEVEKQKKLNKA